MHIILTQYECLLLILYACNFALIKGGFSYSDLINWEMSDIDFISRVVKDGYRPVFKVWLKSSINELIDRNWTDDPNDRPQFGEIFANLTGLDKDSGDIMLDDVGGDELSIYV